MNFDPGKRLNHRFRKELQTIKKLNSIKMKPIEKPYNALKMLIFELHWLKKNYIFRLGNLECSR